jgi:hypothetical protein
MEIRNATEKDLNDIIHLWKDFMDFHVPFDPFWTRSEQGHQNVYKFIRSILKNQNFLILVAVIDNRIIGYQI